MTTGRIFKISPHRSILGTRRKYPFPDENIGNIAYLQDINQNAPENPSGELLVFPYTRWLNTKLLHIDLMLIQGWFRTCGV